MIIRNVTSNDAAYLKTIKPSIDDDTINKRLQQQDEGSVEYLILEDNNIPMCFVLLKWEGKPTHPEYPDLEDLYTNEEYRGKGYGSKILKEVEERAKKKGFKKIGLAVNPDENSNAKRLYEKLGYVHDGGEKYIDGIYDGVEDWAIDLEKSLE